jgi:hypothetical protein
MDFQPAQNQFQHLVQQYQAGQLSQEAFTNAVNQLRVQTTDGTWWQIRAADGAWLRWNGTTWLEGLPPGQSQPIGVPPQVPSVPAAKPKKKRSRVASCFLIFAISALVIVCLVAVVGGGGYYLYSTGQISRREIQNTFGVGYGEISVVNIANEPLDIQLTRLDTDNGEPNSVNSDEIEPLGISGFGGIEPGHYEFEITAPSGQPGGTCRMQIGSGDAYQFVAVPAGVAITQEGVDANHPDDVDMLTSALCRE